MKIDFIESLLQNATQGRRVQFHPYYCAEAKGAPVGTWDTSHDMSVIREDGTRYKIAHYQHAADAALSQAAPELARLYLDLVKATTIKPLKWEPWWYLDEGYRESAKSPIGLEYHVNDEGWWRLFTPLHPCDGIKAAKAAAQADHDARVRATMEGLFNG